MEEKTLLGELEALAHNLDVEIRYETFEDEPFSTGGICRIHGKRIIMVNTSASLGEKCRTLAKALGRFNLTDLYLKPALREFIEQPDPDE